MKIRRRSISTLFPYTTLFRSGRKATAVLSDVGELVDVLDPARGLEDQRLEARRNRRAELDAQCFRPCDHFLGDRKSTRLNSSHTVSSYAVFCLKKKTRRVNPI